MWLAVAGCGAKQPPPAEPPPPKVTVAHPEQRQLVDQDSFTGWLDAAETVDVRAQVRGQIQKIHFTDGDVVKKGQLLIELDPRPFQAQVDLASAKQRMFEAQKVAAEKERDRLESLLSKGGASQSQVDKAEADVYSLEAQIDAMGAEIAARALDLEFSRISAPIAGRIGRAQMTEGNLVDVGSEALTTIVSISPVYAYFNVDERSLQRYQQGIGTKARAAGQDTLRQVKVPVSIGLDSEQGYPHAGVLDFAANKVDAGTGTIQLRGVVDNADGRLTPGSRVRVRIPVSDPYAALLVPDSAVLTDQDRRYLLALGKENIVERRDVTLGKLLDDGMRVVLPGSAGAGIAPDDQIIIEGLQRARIHYPVEPVPKAG